MTKLYSEHEKALYRLTFDTLNEEKFFTVAGKQLPFTVNQDNLGAYNIGFFMWKTGRDDMLEHVLEIVKDAEDVEVVQRKLLALRADQYLKSLLDDVVKAGN